MVCPSGGGGAGVGARFKSVRGSLIRRLWGESSPCYRRRGWLRDPLFYDSALGPCRARLYQPPRITPHHEGSPLRPLLGCFTRLYAAQLAGTGVSSTIGATVPVLLIPVSVLVLKERVTGREVVGALIAVAGVALLFLA